MTREPAWLSPAVASAIHARLVAAHSGVADRPDRAWFEAVLARPRRLQNDTGPGGRPDIFRIAAAHAFGIARDRPLHDGNERLALTLAGVFLEVNGWSLEATEADAVNVTRALATGELDEGGYALWLEEACARRRPFEPASKPPSPR
jgi:death-on-curing protein